ncbi:MAG: type transport system permease protein [Methanomicrobiaceae archaeon]|jgi:ABC-2 type transport system permease protein|nr:type transport system permease protein [Methanomicrobiaceae archaeon]MDK2863073.1 type transport system permease protein [Methanomicrobiaceae archaeon]
MYVTESPRSTGRGLLTVARKELTDHLTSRTFLVFAALLVVVCIIPFQQGLAGYHAKAQAYAEGPIITPWGVEEFGSVPPAAADVYSRLPGALSTTGAILAIAMGFDLVSRERQSGSLKLLLVRPLFRDQIITGKALGGILALTTLVFAGLAASLGFLLVDGIVPDMDALVSILLFALATVAFLAFFFCLALTISTVVPRTGKAFLYALVVLFIFTALVPTASAVAKDVVVGAHPLPGASPAERGDYQARLGLLESVATVFSPQWNYELVAKSVLEPRLTSYSFIEGSITYLPYDETARPTDALARFWQNVLVLFTAPFVLFGIAYIAFQRMDVR